jgi:O-antigen/teichoic acid export membrane protein
MSVSQARPDASEASDGDLGSRALSGLRWNYTATVINALMQIGYTAVMGRVLEPRAFGLVALAGFALRFGSYFARMGVGSALIQRREVSRTDIRAGFTLVAGGLTATAESLLRRQLRFRTLAVNSLISYVVGYFGVGFTAAWMGAGVYSLVAATLAQSVLLAVLHYAAVRHPVTPVLRWGPYRELYGFGARVSVISFLEFLGGDLDTFAVGRFAGTALLGQYNRAFLLVNLPLQQLTTALTKVLFPAFSRMQDDRPRLRRLYGSSIGVAAAILVPTCTGLAVAADEVVAVVLGPQWERAATLLPVLAIAASFSLLSHLAGVLCEATAELTRKLALQAGYLVVLAALMGAAAGGELLAYAWAIAAGELIRHLGYLLLLRRVVGLRGADVWQRYVPAIAAAIPVAAAIAAVRLGLLSLGAPLVAVLAGELVTGAAVLAAGVRLGPFAVLRGDLRDRVGPLVGASSPAVRALDWLLGPPMPAAAEVRP